jgi:hypothetical protein
MLVDTVKTRGPVTLNGVRTGAAIAASVRYAFGEVGAILTVVVLAPGRVSTGATRLNLRVVGSKVIEPVWLLADGLMTGSGIVKGWLDPDAEMLLPVAANVNVNEPLAFVNTVDGNCAVAIPLLLEPTVGVIVRLIGATSVVLPKNAGAGVSVVVVVVVVALTANDRDIDVAAP